VPIRIRARSAVSAPPHRVERIVDFALDPMRALDQIGAGRGGERALAEALDELDTQAVFELAHLQAHRRLGEAQVSRGCRKAPEADDLDDRVQLVED
jgi:hypothetical protein